MRFFFLSPSSPKASYLVICLLAATAGLNIGCDLLMPSSHELSGAPCDEMITADIRPSDQVLDQSNISNYEMSMFENKLVIDLADIDETSLGRVETELDFDLSATTGMLNEWRVSTRFVEGEEVTAAQLVRGRELGKGRIWLEVVHRAGDEELLQWTVVGEQEEFANTAIAVEVDDASEFDEEELLEMPDGRIFEVLDITENGGDRIDQAEIDAWIDERLGDVFETDPAWQRLTMASDDDLFWEGADAHVRLCKAASIDPAEQELIVQRQSLCALEADEAELKERHQPQCKSGAERLADILSGGLAINGAIGDVKTGMKITKGLVAAGVIAGTGASLGAVFVGSVVAVVLIDMAVSHVVSENRDTVFDVAGFGGSLVTGDRQDGRAMADFFKGGDTSSRRQSSGDARSGGDPHFDTFDGLSFDYHGAGEFVLVESTSGSPFEVQVRQEPAEGVCSGVGVNTGVATQIGGSRIAFYAEEPNPLYVNGSPTALPGGALALGDGGSIEKDPSEPVGFIVRWPDGEQMEVAVREWNDNGLVNADMILPSHRAGQVRGLLGNFNDDPTDDITPRGGSPLSPPVDWRDLTHLFGESWRVDSSDSLFDYLHGESWSDFVIDGFPDRPTLLEDLPQEGRQDAEVVCAEAGIENEIAFDGCVMDIVCTGSNSLADSHVDRDPEMDLELTVPIFLDDWEQQGDPSNGDWEVSSDGSSVIQSVNGDPTFFVSPQEFEDVTIRGTFSVDQSSDDDFIGFVFGYQEPIESNEDDPDEFDTFLLSWKAHDQELSGGHLGPEGFVLSHLKGEVPSSDYHRLLWGHEDTDVHRVIDTHFEQGRGWRAFTNYPFELTYTEDEIVIVIGGEEIFRVDAANTPASHTAGRFGFYNYSQASVVYGDFQSQSAEPEPTASLEGLEVGVRRPGSNYHDFEMDTGDPRLCREVCLDDGRCDAFTYRRPVFRGDGAHCWLKDEVPDPVDDPGYITGVR